MRQRILAGILLASVLLLATTISTTAPSRAYAAVAAQPTTADISAIEVSLDSTLNPNDMTFGIACNPDDEDVYVAVYQQGLLAKIDKSTKTVSTLIQHPDGAQASGRGFYSLAKDSSGNIYVNEVEKGRVLKFNTVTESWSIVPIVENLDEPDNPRLDYPSGFTDAPNVIRVNETGTDHDIHTYSVSLASYGGLLYAGGYVWVGLNYNIDFDEHAESVASVNDKSFSGLARIDPSTLQVTRYEISGSTAPAAMNLDKSESNIIWVTDYSLSKVYRFDINSGTVTATVNLPANSRPRGIDNDGLNLYIALNTIGDSTTNSQILKVSKADPDTQTVIDTGAVNNFLGTFSVYVYNGYLLWTDESAHVGAINLSNTSLKSVSNTTFAGENRFGCLATSSEFWWAAHGSVKAGVMSIPNLEQDNNEQQPPTPSSNDGSFTLNESAKVKYKEGGKKTRSASASISITGEYFCQDTSIDADESTLQGTIRFKGVEYSLENISISHKGRTLKFSADVGDGSRGHISGSISAKQSIKCEPDGGMDGDSFRSKTAKLSGSIDGKRLRASSSEKGSISFS